MRIISGTKRGALIRAPKSLPVRPITDRNKESLFNILANHMEFEGIDVLDLFAGTGNMSFEFCSRGAANVVSVDQDDRCVKFMIRQAEIFGFDQMIVERAGVLQFIGAEYRTYDIIFADPPFAWKHYEKMLTAISETGLLKPEGFLITEHYQDQNFSHLSGFMEERKYGQTRISFFRKPAE